MSEKKKVTIVNLITGSRIVGTFLLPIITSIFGPLGTAIYIASLWLTDAIDGYLAKHKWKVSTIFGANLDAFSDKLFGVAILIYLSGFYQFMIMPLIAELAIFGVNWHYGKKGADVKSSYLGKFKTAVLDISTVLAIISTLTNGLAFYIPIIINMVTLTQTATLIDYINTNREYLKKHKPKNDVSDMGFFETIKTIIKKLGDQNLYSPSFYRQHKNEPLLDILLNKETTNVENVNIKNIEKQDNKEIKKTRFSLMMKNELKNDYCLLDSEIDKIETFSQKNNIDSDIMMEYLREYLETRIFLKNITIQKMEEYILEKEEDKVKSKKKQ